MPSEDPQPQSEFDPNGSQSLAAIFEKGIENLSDNEVQLALGCFERVLELDQDHAMANYQVGMIGLRLFNQEVGNRFLGRAIETLREQSRVGPMETAAWLALVHCLVVLGRGKEASDAAEDVVADLPNDRGADLAVAKFFVQISLHDVAIPMLERCVAARSDDPMVYSEFGKALAATSRRAEAIAAFERAIELVPHVSEFYLELGQIYQGDNLTASRAVVEYRRGVAAAPSDKLYLDCAGALRTCGRFDEAAELLQEAIEVCPRNALDVPVEMRYLLGQVLRLAGRESEAKRAAVATRARRRGRLGVQA